MLEVLGDRPTWCAFTVSSTMSWTPASCIEPTARRVARVDVRAVLLDQRHALVGDGGAVRAGDDGDGDARAGEPDGEIPADGARADDGDAHDFLMYRLRRGWLSRARRDRHQAIAIKALLSRLWPGLSQLGLFLAARESE